MSDPGARPAGQDTLRSQGDGLSYEATIRNVWRIEGDKVRHFEVFHDAARLRAFFEMVNRMGVEA